MATDRSLGAILEDVQHEAGLSANPSVGINFREQIKYRINEAREYFFRKFDWSHLCGDEENGMFEVLTVAGERTYDLPTELDPATIKAVWYKWGDVWVPLARGIEPPDYTAQDGDNVDVVNDPAMKWDRRAGDTFEIWPRPATDALPIRFRAKKKCVRLTADADICDIDDYIVRMRAAGYLLLRREPKEAQRKIDDAEAIMYQLRHHDTLGIKSNLAGHTDDANVPRDPSERIIAVSRG